MIQILVNTRKMKSFCDFFRRLPSTRNIGEFNFIKNHGFKMIEKGPETLIQSQGLLAENHEEDATFHRWEISSAHSLPQDRISQVFL